MDYERADGGPAFPHDVLHFDGNGKPDPYTESGMSLRDYFAIRAPEPSNTEVEFEYKKDQMANPHNDSYRPKRRSELEIRAWLRYRYADAMLAERKKRGS